MQKAKEINYDLRSSKNRDEERKDKSVVQFGLWSIEIHILAKLQAGEAPCSTAQSNLI